MSRDAGTPPGGAPELVLASTSPYRRALLARLGVPFRCVPPPFDEAAYPREGLTPAALAGRLAEGKARSVAALEPAATVIGSDQLATIDGEVLGKPLTRERAAEQLERLSGRTHELITALVVVSPLGERRHVDRTRLTMRGLDRAAIERYVARDMPLDCAGSYKLEQRGIALFESIESEDHAAIVGLPLIRLVTILRDLGHEIP
ncbi:Maf-like protein YceF [Aquisphaera giovannonii]|uniref:7-methyl-GTP pyrophosphatase n=1 Tax=Aquisphaera giovannonii TaxID=406548 RepID=A0A5B9WAM8_9BACT|nr:nucleoside triphosphate pyrophosphatase [Aquisphaera giovannonii]QEH37517.1 Maf-like protein YceF [Aquisphaera giovannonii]